MIGMKAVRMDIWLVYQVGRRKHLRPLHLFCSLIETMLIRKYDMWFVYICDRNGRLYTEITTNINIHESKAHPKTHSGLLKSVIVFGFKISVKS